MKKNKTFIYLLIGLFFSAGASADTEKPVSPQPAPPIQTPTELQRMKDYIKNRIDPTTITKSLRTTEGRQVDCVAIEKQPALQNPALKGHVVQRAPHSPVAFNIENRNAPPIESMTEVLYEFDPANGKLGAISRCPNGTVPIRSVTLEDVRRFPTLRDYFAKEPWTSPKTTALPFGRDPEPLRNGPTDNHQYAHAYRYVQNWGAQANINIWSPGIELNTEFSLAQIWVVGGTGGGLQTLEVGVQKYHNLYNDDRTHLFIYSTQDGYQHTGCYNNSCHDFIQVSSTLYPGTYFNTVSTYNGTQYEINVHWFKDMDGGAWWLNVQGQWVGYYPRTLYNTAGVQNNAAEIDYGGEIIDNRNLGLHTSTDMGSGHFPGEWYKKAAYIRLLKYNYKTTTNPNTVWSTESTGLTMTRSDALCYDIQYYSGDANWGSYMFYGGPGYDSVNCR